MLFADWGVLPVAGWATAIATILGAIGIFIVRERKSRAAYKEVLMRLEASTEVERNKAEAEVDGQQVKTQITKEKADLHIRQKYIDHVIDKWEELYGTAIQREANCQIELSAVKTEFADFKQKHDSEIRKLHQEINELRNSIAKKVDHG